MTDINGHRNDLFHVIEASEVHHQYRYEAGDPDLEGTTPEVVSSLFSAHLQAHCDEVESEYFQTLGNYIAAAIGLLSYYEAHTNRESSLRVRELYHHLSRCKQLTSSLRDDLPKPKEN